MNATLQQALSAKAPRLTELVAAVDRLSTQEVRSELETLVAIRDWAVASLGLDYGVGDRVQIATEINTENGWRGYHEAFAIGATGRVTAIHFNTSCKAWQAMFVLDREWSVSVQPNGGTIRFWRGRVEDTPEGFTPPSPYDQEHTPEGRKHSFAFDVRWLRGLAAEIRRGT